MDTTTAKITRYTWDNPKLVPLRSDDLWDNDIVTAAGFDPEDEEVTVCDLAEEWNGHPAGSLVVTELTVRGHSFAVVEIEPETAPSPTVAEARALLEDAVNDLGPEAHDTSAGSCRKDRNDAVSAVRGGADPAEVARGYFGV